MKKKCVHGTVIYAFGAIKFVELVLESLPNSRHCLKKQSRITLHFTAMFIFGLMNYVDVVGSADFSVGLDFFVGFSPWCGENVAYISFSLQTFIQSVLFFQLN